MAIRATIPLLFLLASGLLFAGAVGTSREEESRRGEHSLRECQQRCERDRPSYQRAQCVQECRDQQQQWEHEQSHGHGHRGDREHEREQEQGRGDREQEQEQGRGRRGDREHEQSHGHGRRGDREHEREQEQGRGRRGDREQEQEQGRGRRGDREQEHEQDRGRRGDREQEQEQGRGRRGDRQREGQQEQDSRRPYVFGPRSFRSIVRSDQGFIEALRPFNEESRLLRGIKNYRVAIMEVNPRSFVEPGYTDADGIGYVAQGEGVLTVIENGEKRSYTVRQGDVVAAPAGSIMHLANTDGRRKLIIVKILNTISVPGQFQYFLGESLVSSLSKRVQRAAFKSSDERLEKLFGRQGRKKQGFIVRASPEQVRELRRHASEGGQSHHWPFGGDSRSTYNLLEQRPTIANRHGRLYEVDARSFRALGDQDVRVSFANITTGSMTAPYYNTQSVKISVVLEGEGEVEIVCPHLSQDSERHQQGQSEREHQQRGHGSESESESEQQQQEKYQTIRARVSRGSALVVPPGHPAVAISSSRGSNNLQIVCFEINAQKNERVWLAGKNNVLGKLDRPAKELTFGAPAREVDEVLEAQQEEGFFAGPEQQQGHGEEEWRHRGRGEEAVESFLRMATGAF
ncbi:63 kDa globulin-like protein [Lolium rigidum]|uniref:63 kDa globulin-like protein n=1 Tax=Lolium rigidum TaxID=89674 RepID=UPI001F5C52E1|nr:63 kDa globulin-like protein [Lolium rigidum]